MSALRGHRKDVEGRGDGGKRKENAEKSIEEKEKGEYHNWLISVDIHDVFQ